MKRSVINKFGMMESKLSGYVAQLNFRFMNLCVKAEPMSLLSARFNIQGEEKPIEDVAQVSKKGDYQFMAIPNFEDDMAPLAVGIALKHPEFKQEYGEETVNVVDEQGNPQSVKVKYLLLTMPEVDNNRYDVLKESVKTLYDQCMTEIEKVKAKYTQILADKTSELPKKEADEATDQLKKLTDQYDDICKTYRDKKVEEIEISHQVWLADEAEKRLNRIQGNKK